MILRGDADATRAEARALVAHLDPDDVLFVGEDRGSVAPSAVKKLLGRAFDAVVLDLHRGIDADVLGQCQGFVWGGGALVLRMPPRGAPPSAGRERLAVFPYDARDVTHRFWDRFERCLARSDAVVPVAPLSPAPHDVRGTDEQARVVAELARAFTDDAPSSSVLLSDRGRGKSSALGLAIGAALSRRPLRVAVTADHEASTAEVFRFARSAASSDPRFVSPAELLRCEGAFDVIVVDEAAQLPVPLLEQLVRHHPRARIAFATTARGYEGTGRGFVLRFLEWLEHEPRPLARYTLTHPIRWDEGDPLERLIFDALLLDADPADPRDVAGAIEHARLDRGALARDDARLRELFGLLVHAHYRTTPSDLQRLLDAPNLEVHASLAQGHVVAATLIAREGGLPRATCEELAAGRHRIRGHALPDTLIAHAGRTDAGELAMIRSVRIAVHPAMRRRGLALALVDHVHASYAPDLFGTLFGATPELLRFRRAVGYELVRVGVSRGARTGEPAAIMLRPDGDEARALVRALREDLARDLPLQLELLEGELALDPELAAELGADLPEPAPLADDEVRAIVDAYLASSRPVESAAYAITRFVRERERALDVLPAPQRALIRARVLERRAWTEAAAGYPSVPAAMRALRPAIAALAESA